jgi:hypothetical protein
MLSPIHPVFLDIWPWENMATLVSHPLLPTGHDWAEVLREPGRVQDQYLPDEDRMAL